MTDSFHITAGSPQDAIEQWLELQGVESPQRQVAREAKNRIQFVASEIKTRAREAIQKRQGKERELLEIIRKSDKLSDLAEQMYRNDEAIIPLMVHASFLYTEFSCTLRNRE